MRASRFVRAHGADLDPPIRLVPSILNADLAALKDSLRMLELGRADGVHVDVMDGHFVPNLSMGPHMVESIRRHTDLPIDVHLMVTDPGQFVGPFVRAGASSLTVHAEGGRGVRRLLDRIRSLGAGAALALRPRTPLSALHGLLEHADMVLLMTVEPGFGGQPFQARVLPKIRGLRHRARRLGLRLDIQVDGGVTVRTARRAIRAGANVLVAGVAIFGAPDPARAITRLRRAAEAARHRNHAHR
jgi:ribulose-phosphate 3-epimerase